MFKLTFKIPVALTPLLCVGAAIAQDSKALIDVLIQKGILNQEEVSMIQRDLNKRTSATEVSTSKGKYLEKLSLSGRFQFQYAGLSTDIDGTNSDPAATNHLFMRRIYFGAKAELGHHWSGTLNYDFAGSTFDAAFIEWKRNDAFVLDIGLRKVPFGLEEWYTSSSNLRAIERSPATRFFVESNNGRRLGAGSYRTGIFLGGKNARGVFYNVAISNPEREESAAGATSTGSPANNNMAYWANLGFTTTLYGGVIVASCSLGMLPDQGGKILGNGDNLTVYNAFIQYTKNTFDLQVECFGSRNENGAALGRDSASYAFSIQPAYKVGDLEYVGRYSYVDSDGRGLTTSDLIRSAPSGGSMGKLTELFLGINYYICGNDVKWQLGYIHGESRGAIAGGKAKAITDGIRSMMQLNY